MNDEHKEASEKFKTELGSYPPKSWPIGKVTGTHGKLKALYGDGASTVWQASLPKASKELRAEAERIHQKSISDEVARSKARNMKESLVSLISNKNLTEAETTFKEMMNIFARKKLLEYRKIIGARIDEARHRSEGEWKTKSDHYHRKTDDLIDRRYRILDRADKLKDPSATEHAMKAVDRLEHKIKRNDQAATAAKHGHLRAKWGPTLKETLSVVPPKKRTPEEMAAGMSDYSKSGAGQKEQIGKRHPTTKQVIRVVKESR